MNVDTVELWSNDKLICSLDVSGENLDNPFVVMSMTGTDADQIIPRYYGSGAETGTQWHDLTLRPREITMRIGLNPDYKVGLKPSYLRDTLYKAIATHRNGRVLVKFLEDGVAGGVIYGFITRFEAPLFTKTPQIQLTIFCRDPLIRSEARTSINIAGLDLENLVLVDPISTAPHGFQFVADITTFTATEVTFSIREKELNPDWNFWFYYPLAFGDGTLLYFSSEVNNKYLYKTVGGLPEYLLGYVDVGSQWPVMFPGENSYFVQFDGVEFVWDSVSFYETHWGI